jgi:tetratricopeptide (TPR) repeat protein
MDEQTVKLYGYQDEKGQIEIAISEQSTLRFLGLHGRGGIGKTTMLRAIHEKYQANEGYRVTDLLDFDDLRLHILQNILEAIASQLRTSQEPFTDYFVAAANLRKMQREGVSRLRVEDQEHRTREAFLQDYYTLAEQRRSILLFDTVEKVQDFDLWQELVSLLLQLENTVVLLAGRRSKEVGESLRRWLTSPEAIQIIPLTGLSEKESLEYFERTDLGKFLASEDPEQSRIVCRLSAGRPILIDLAVDWLGRGMKLAMPGVPLNELDESSLRELRYRFEHGLVEKVNDLSQPTNEAILDMAHIYHYFDAEKHSYLHDDYSLEDSQVLLDEMRTLSFVKPQPGGGVRLHDEMQRMVNEYVWPVLDKSGARRRWLSERIAQYYDRHLAEYEDNPVAWQALITEQLYHRLYANIRQGHQSFRPVFRQAIDQLQFDFAHVLLNTLNQFSADFDQEIIAWAEAHKGRLLRAEEKVQEAVELIRPAKEKLQALGIREELDTVCNALGYCYRLLGDWGQAIAAYEEALAYSREERDVRQIAETMNNIANACRLGGDLEHANRYSLVSLKIREQLGDKRAIGNSCYVRGMVCWESGNEVEAANYLRRARGCFVEVDDLQGIAEVSKYESYMHFCIGDFNAASRLLEPAKEVFSEKGIGVGLADALNLEARILLDRYAAEGETDETFQEIEPLTQKALSVAERIRDHYKIAECHLTLCRLYYQWGHYCQGQGNETSAQEYYRLAREQYDDPEGGQAAHQRNYLAPWSIYEETMGDMAYNASDWKTAFEHYLQECAIASRHKEFRFARVVNRISDRLHNLPAAVDGSQELTRQYCDYVIARWKECGLIKDFPAVVEECEHIKAFLGLEDQQRLDQLRQLGTDLLARGEWQRAVDVYQELLRASQTYTPNEQVIEAMAQSARAHLAMGHFSQARRLCQQSLQICQRVRDLRLLASNHRVMSALMWTTGNTTEAARHLRLARQLCEESGDEVGVAHVYRHMAFSQFRIGERKSALDYLTEAETVFREKKLHAELADAMNLHAVILRQEGWYDEALELAQQCRRLAERNGIYYTLAEAWLTLGLIEYDIGQKALEEGNKEKAQQHFEQAKAFHRNGYPIAEHHNYDLLLSVYEGVAGNIASNEGRYAAAFEHYIRDLEFGARFERARMRRELDRIIDRLVRLPENMFRFYADYVITEWQDRGLAEAEPDVSRVFQLLKEYREYV